LIVARSTSDALRGKVDRIPNSIDRFDSLRFELQNGAKNEELRRKNRKGRRIRSHKWFCWKTYPS